MTDQPGPTLPEHTHSSPTPAAMRVPAPQQKEATPPGVTPQLPTFFSGRAWATLIISMLISVAADLATKAWAFRTLGPTPVHIDRTEVLAANNQLWTLVPDHPPRTVIPQVLDLKLVLNPGAVFGIGAGKRWFFVIFTVVAIAVGLWMFATWTRARDRLSHAAIGLILGGGLGNLYDRLLFACVRDFIHPLPDVRLPFGWAWPWGGRDIWPYVSNVADALLIAGVLILAWKALRGDRHHAPRR
ncbi:MAG: signal peptidase II [Phycisphaerales bacterium]